MLCGVVWVCGCVGVWWWGEGERGEVVWEGGWVVGLNGSFTCMCVTTEI